MNEKINEGQQINKAVIKATGAMLGTAIGDAVGWPYEFRKGKPLSLKLPFSNGSLEFNSWVRRPGGRYYVHEEKIEAGEYSDDTQLTLATARSLISHNENWIEPFTQYELPLWSIYERGGGRSTKHSVKNWVNGKEPWATSLNKTQVQEYFNAGGNGVAMRILPHVLYKSANRDFKKVANEILVNGICTHGHPRALIGAIAYAYALWLAFRTESTLKYGELIHSLLNTLDTWDLLEMMTYVNKIFPNWFNEANLVSNNRYVNIWQDTILELKNLLEIAYEGIGHEALSIDNEILEKLGCFDKNIGGAGTVTAVTAIFLASRYAADPVHGLMEAAILDGADTDTIASMTGAILGALSGTEWLGMSPKFVQDSEYIKALAEKLTCAEPIMPGLFEITNNFGLATKEVNAITRRLESAKVGDKIAVGNELVPVIDIIKHPAIAKNTYAISWKVKLFDSQIVYFKKVGRLKVSMDLDDNNNNKVISNTANKMMPVGFIRAGVQLFVKDINQSRIIYEKALGLPVTKESQFYVSFAGVISLNQPRKDQYNNYKMTSSPTNIYIETGTIDSAWANVTKLGLKVIQQLTTTSTRRSFKCNDPDGNIIEVYETIK